MFVHFVLLAIEALAQNGIFLLLNSYVFEFLYPYSFTTYMWAILQSKAGEPCPEKLRNFVKLLSQKGLQNDFIKDLDPMWSLNTF